VAALAEMYVQGVSTRKVKAITEELCGHSFSASSISAINQRLDDGLAQFADRRLVEAFPYLILDRALRAGARGRRDRQPGGPDRDRDRLGRPPQVLAVELANRESRSSWRDFLLGLKRAVFMASSSSWPMIMPACGQRCAKFWRRRPIALLRAFSAQRARPRPAPGRRRLSAGAALAV